MKLVIENHRGNRFLYLAASSLFLFFLIHSSPHRVHHVFDHDPSEAEACLAFSVAKGCHLQPPASIQLPSLQVATGNTAPALDLWIPHLSPFPFFQRAPPIA